MMSRNDINAVLAKNAIRPYVLLYPSQPNKFSLSSHRYIPQVNSIHFHTPTNTPGSPANHIVFKNLYYAKKKYNKQKLIL